jgi:uncharacterized protein (DUF924 family)
MSTPDEVLAFWFAPSPSPSGPPEDGTPVRKWFTKSAAFDAEIHERFGADIAKALDGGLEDWARMPPGDARTTLAYVVLLDQMTRNTFRGSPRAFAGDARALAATLGAVDSGLDRALGWLERYVLYMPTMHAEDRGAQARGVDLFRAAGEEAAAAGAPEGLVAVLRSAHDYAVRHRVIVDRFGRFPHRNAVLGRPSTEEEIAFLKEPGSSFG